MDVPLLGGRRGRADIVFSRARLVVMVDGCFWHGCPEHGEMPASNREFWETKIGRTRERDLQQTAILRAAGWTVLRVWEHEPIDDAVQRVFAALPEATRGHAPADPRVLSEREQRGDRPV